MEKRLSRIYKKLLRAFGPQGWWPAKTPFEIAVGAVLTQNTNWSNVEKAIGNLKKGGKLSARAVYEMPESELSALIRPSGYFNIKAGRLKSFVDFLVEDYGGSMKRMKKQECEGLRERLLEIKGIGPETADSILLYALEKPVFVIDAYTKRVLSRHSMVEEDAPYEVLQGLFHGFLKRDVRLFNEYHALFVRVGKTFCRPREPLCGGCPLRERMSRA